MADETQPQPTWQSLFTLSGETAVVMGGGGVLGGALARALGQAGARVAIVGRRAEPALAVAEAIRAVGGVAAGYACDALDRMALARTADEIGATLGPVGVLVNAAGGNTPQATTTDERTFFDLDMEAVRGVFDGNLLTTILPCQVFGRGMAERGRGSIVNIASMSGIRPLTRIPAYSAAKAAVVNFTQWLAVHMAQEYSVGVRVNALAPGFFLTEQNRYLLTDRASGAPTARAQSILAHTPMGRLGQPDDLVGALLWLASPASAFVTGVVVPVDGGFAAFGGV